MTPESGDGQTLARGPYPQGSWPPPGPPPNAPRGNLRWVVLALAFLAVIAVSVAATVWVTHRVSGAGRSQASANGESASAGDTGPVGIITEDPTCDRWVATQNQVAAQLTEWGNRDSSVPASAWTPVQREMFESAARVWQAQAERLIPLARETPHRVMRELYEQRIAYTRAYANAISNYTPVDDNLAIVGNDLGAALSHICLSIANFAVANRGTSVPAAAAPTAIAPVGDPANPQRFLTAPSDACPRITALAQRKQRELEQWYKTDSNIPASQRSPADQVLAQMAATVLGHGADELDQIGRSAGNPVMEDFLVLAAQYYRAYVNALPSSIPADEEIYGTAQSAQVAVYDACKIVQR